MATYFFHVRHVDGVVPDREGSTFQELELAKEEAREVLRELVGHALLSKRSRIPLGVLIYDASGDVVAEVYIDAAIPEIARAVGRRSHD